MVDGVVRSYLTMAQAARCCPGTAGRHHPSPGAVFRWARYGLKSRSGQVVRLQHARCGRGLYTTADWLHEFFAKLAAADLPHWETKNGGDQRSIAEAEARLRAAGL